MKTKVKICGLRSVRDIEIVNKYSVDYVGFVFAESKRKVSIHVAKAMIEALRKDIKAVGVFVNTLPEEINKITDYCKLDIVQLHGNETLEDCEKIKAPIWKSISVKSKADVAKIELYKNAQGILLDGLKPGSGECFKWDLAKGISDKYFTILAGGLTHGNVSKAIQEVKPQVVDVSSGVETDSIKDEEKIRGFVSKVKE
ncbi:N-(5'-phosphoribosyl)anthranilate isomerase [Clostridium homopropionicum DSM 5847]|uniref:N-(5'-phosphoribosyl)anthranilate isomerase n=1 Tax=Clostridium homopropionicum DSM 5847 TaxID=1121318 RepID=A0A0L6ZAH5_9CLOT|nr:phosphoribosylanthranilate isomerase [Clostridium homopropionicum]KOA19975.1 N-(5'-phosphoribosyl)anthranilate isomerase [Clostridium homopropionicum DSM 5847]SFG63728.1 phosphoribosylanthranilate isomerase [Clostridium homopropionicum]